MKKTWTITIETSEDGVIKVVADSWKPEGPLSEKEKELLAKVLEPFVIQGKTEQVKEIIVSAKIGKDIIYVVTGSGGHNSLVYRNGVPIERIRHLILDIPADGTALLTLDLMPSD